MATKRAWGKGRGGSIRRRLYRLVALLAGPVILLEACSVGSAQQASAAPLDRIKHTVVIYLENWSFDSLYGSFPGANGLSQAGAAATQVDKNGMPYDHLPQPLDSTKITGTVTTAPPDPRFPADLKNAPFSTAAYVPENGKTGDLVGRFYQEQQQIDGGRMDKFVAAGNSGGLPMGYYNAVNLPLGQLAKGYTLADNFFHASFGGSFLNHMYLVSARPPTWPNAPASMVAQLDAAGNLVKDGAVTPDGYAVNTVYTVSTPHPATITDPQNLLPLQTAPTIGDRLSAKGVDWAWYSGGWSDAVAGHPDPLFQFNHQPFAYFANYADGTAARAAHLKDEQHMIAAIKDNKLPAVSFFKPIGQDNEHPGYANLLDGELHAAGIIQQIMHSKMWKDTAIIVTYDENGGFWDHVAPPKGGRWGPGTRVPAMIISPFAKKGFVDHTTYDTTSILAFLEKRYQLEPLGPRDAKAADLENAFAFSRTSGHGASAAPAPYRSAAAVGPMASLNAPQGTAEVDIVNFAFTPAELTVKAGTTVRWTNSGHVGHTVSFVAAGINSDVLNNGDHFTRTFTTPGTYPYICGIHPFMHGTVLVTP